MPYAILSLFGSKRSLDSLTRFVSMETHTLALKLKVFLVNTRTCLFSEDTETLGVCSPEVICCMRTKRGASSCLCRETRNLPTSTLLCFVIACKGSNP